MAASFNQQFDQHGAWRREFSLRLEVAGHLGCSAGMATEHIAAGIDLKFRHPRLFEAVQAFGSSSAIR